jgi:hypothetical protein
VPYSVSEQQPRDNFRAVIDMIRQKRRRAAPYAIPSWWHEAAVAAFRASGMGQVEAAAKLSAAVKREQPWTHGTISKFLGGTYVTEELVAALAVLFDLPLPVYHPASLAEAVALKAAAQSSRVLPSTTAGVGPSLHAAGVRRDAKLAAADRELEQIGAKSQSGSVPSEHGDKGKPRARAVVPARPAARRS